MMPIKELLKLLNLSQFTKKQKFLLALILILGFILMQPLLKLLGKSPAPTVNVNSSNIGVEINNGISNKGIDSRSATTKIVGDNNKVTNNSDSITNK